MTGLRRVTLVLGLGLLVLVALSVTIGLVIGGRDSRVLPVNAAAHFPDEHRDDANRYTSLKLSYWGVGTALRWGMLAAIVALGGGARFAAAGRRLGRGRVLASAFFTSALLLGFLALAGLPLSFQSGHRAELAFGLTSQSAGAWLVDWAREQGFWILLYSAVAGGFLAILHRWPRRGWAIAGAAGVVLAFAGAFLAPRLIDPLFYDFTPLEDRALARDIEALGTRAGVEVRRVLVMNASRRTNRLNAYVTGLGATRQVVLYDNLIERAPRQEVLLVVGHEIGHATAHHVRKGLLLSLPMIIVGAWALGGLARVQARETSLPGPGDPAGLPLLWLALSLGLFMADPALQGVRRSMEADADWASLELTRDPQTYVSTAERLTLANLMPVEPPRLLVFWLYSHPPVLERIGMARYWAQQNTLAR